MIAGPTRGRLRGLYLLLVSALCVAHVHAQSTPATAGQSLFRLGILPSNEPLTAKRESNLESNLKISGADAACANCHRRSGLGEIDGHIRIPPISGPYLFHSPANGANQVPLIDSMHPERGPYTDATLARAIREGIDADGRPLDYLMPRYDLSDADMAILIDYLRGMTPAKVPGVSGSELHLATIITPDADPLARKGMLDVLGQFFKDKDEAAASSGVSSVGASQRMVFKIDRRWRLHVWELTGPPATWEQQLRDHLKREPVFAVISGVGGGTWEPVHRFCEQAALPCLLPNVDLPVVAEHDYYSLYFSRGVLLEADLIASALAGSAGRIVQVYRGGDIGEQAAQRMSVAAAAAGLQTVDRKLGSGGAQRELAHALRDVGSHDALLLWLRPTDLVSLEDLPAVKSKVFISGLMGGLEHSPMPPQWRDIARIAYPVDLPEKRRTRMDYAMGWFRLRGIPVVDERVQADTYVACEMLDQTLNHMATAIFRDYLVEHLEHMLESQLVTGYYPRLALAPNQRFASKGGYIVHFAGPTGARVLADGDWMVP